MGRWRSAARRTLLCALLLAGGCGGPAHQSSLPESTAGAIEYPAVPLSERSAELRVTEDLVVGAESGDPNYVLTIDGFAVGPQGTMYVLEAKAREVRVFDADGVFLQTLGGQGQGPGEISGRPLGIALAAGNLVVYDLGAWLFHVWSANGEFIDRHRLAGLLNAYQFMGTSRGTILFAGNLLGAVGGAGGDPTNWRLQELGITGKLVRDLAAVEPVAPTVRIGDRTLSLYMEEGRNPRAALGPEDEVVFWSAMDEYEVVAVSAAGVEQWRLRVPWPREEISGEVKRRALESNRRFAPTATVGDVTWPDDLPALSLIATDGDGRLYVFPRAPAADAGSAYVPLDVYSAAGDVLFVGKMRRLFAGSNSPESWLAARGSHIYGKREEQDGTVQLVRYRIDESAFDEWQ